MTDLFQLINSS